MKTTLMQIFQFTIIAFLCGCQSITQELFLPNEGVRERQYKVIKL